MKIIIIEDNIITGEGLCEDVLALGYTPIGPFVESEKALEAFEEYLPDLALVDIELNGSLLDGIELVAAFKQRRDIPIIFLSGNHDSVTRQRAKMVRPDYFLSKPVLTLQLDIAIDFAMSNFYQQQASLKPSNIYAKSHAVLSSFFIKDNSKYTRIDVENILYLKAAGSSVEIFTTPKRIVASMNLSKFLKKLNHSSFCRAHKSYAVNLEKVIEYDSFSVFVNYKTEMQNIPIGEMYRKELLDRLGRLK